MASIPSPTPRMRRAYDHRLREHVVRSGARSLARHVAIPRSTVSTWQRRGLRPVVTIEPLDQDRQRLLVATDVVQGPSSPVCIDFGGL